jgi:hypothetical protein
MQFFVKEKIMKIAGLLGILMLMSVSGVAMGDILMSDDFESVPGAASFPAVGGTNYLPSISPWTTRLVQNATSLVVYQASAGLPVASGNQSLRMKYGTALPTIDGGFSANTNLANVSMDIYIPNAAANTRVLNISLRDYSIASGKTSVIGPYLSINNDSETGTWGIGYYYYKSGTPTFKAVVTPSTDTWKTLSFIADVTTHTMSITYDGVTYDNDGAGFAWFGSPSTLGALNISSSTANGACIDNVLVTNTVPEPLTMITVLSGLAGGILFKKKRI